MHPPAVGKAVERQFLATANRLGAVGGGERGLAGLPVTSKTGLGKEEVRNAGSLLPSVCQGV